ncbi:MAG: hypothetical protein JW915_21215 [Chitinispirillaceae bacterium]|nr:hypothetical protein [Chitinispirillaceae bacterium]
MYSHFVMSLIVILFLTINSLALSKTNGTPLGGMGTGYVIYNALTGDFATSGKLPPAGSDMEDEFVSRKSVSSGFHFFAGGECKQKAISNIEDAKFPFYSADFGNLNDIGFTLGACSPLIPGADPINYQLATSPLAFFEIIATNRGAKAVEVAVAMEFTNKSSTQNLLGGADNAIIDTSSNNKAISFPGTSTTGNAYLAVDCEGASPLYSAGGFGTFLTNGILDNTSGNLVAAKCTIAAGGTVHFKFVLSWWRSFISTVDRYGSGKVDEDNYYYHNFYADSKDVGLFGMTHFDKVINGVRTMVQKVMGSNFPYYYREKLLNNLYPQIHNTLCAKDGRVAFWEGHYGNIGIIDQGQHAALWYTWNWPQHQWQELQYWYRTSHKGIGEDPSLNGQIHHDFNSGELLFTHESRFMCPWDNYLHKDYWWCPITTDWADLNIMTIFKTYELMLATGNIDSMKVYVPKAIITADRLMSMCAEAGKHIPIASRSTYDTQGDLTPGYLSGLALAAYRVMEELTTYIGDTTSAKKYREWYNIARKECETLIYTPDFCRFRDYAEGDLAGYSWANYFCLEPIMAPEIVTEGCKRLRQLYLSQNEVQKKLGRWHFYTCDHWGGTEIACGNPDTAMNLFKMDYDFFHAANPEMVFWQDLWADNSIYSSYMTAPSVWRSYFQMTGYMLDNANNRLWIRPRIPQEMNQLIVNAPLLNSKCWGNLNYDGRLTDIPNQSLMRTQKVSVTFDSLVTIKEIVLNNSMGTDKPFVRISLGSSAIDSFNCTTEGAGHEKNIRIAFKNPLEIGPCGLLAEVYADRVGFHNATRVTPQTQPLSINSGNISNGKPIHFSIDVAGPVTIDLLNLNGTKICTILQKHISSPGKHSAIWNNKATKTGTLSQKILVMRLIANSGSVCKLVSSVQK